ncbi:hypothetical protein BpHYR1_038429 [Brachionus plicatilis]|uniref:Uncharacterized protein n=1 Tax=Brachionus plicatilis TaxID=10195 RepID=A0A3M7Q0C1_BRAPC|nr:hypothetical protein BpHYR1_038429 [Brachionus plicatilis]
MHARWHKIDLSWVLSFRSPSIKHCCISYFSHIDPEHIPNLQTWVPELHSVLSFLKKAGLSRGHEAFLPEQNTLVKHSLLFMQMVSWDAKLQELSQHGPWLGLHAFPGLSLHLFISWLASMQHASLQSVP